jgi:hypothetical protein
MGGWLRMVPLQDKSASGVLMTETEAAYTMSSIITAIHAIERFQWKKSSWIIVSTDFTLDTTSEGIRSISALQ